MNVRHELKAKEGAPVRDQGHEHVSNSRRQLLKGAVSTVPVILTLQSGAALARTSNLISTTTEPGAVDAVGRYQCLDTASVAPADANANVWDLGEPPYAEVSAIVDRDYYTQANLGGTSLPVSEGTMCDTGGIYYYQGGGWQQVNVPNGILVSSTALMSFAGSVIVTEI